MHGFSYWTILGAPDLETNYATLLVVLATAVTTCYVWFMTSHRYRPIPPLPSLFRARKSSQILDILPERDDPRNIFASTCDDDLALSGKGNSPITFHDPTDPIVEPQASFVESGRRVPDGPALSEPGSTTVQPGAHLDSGTSVPESERHKAEEPPELELPHVDGVIADPPLAVHSEIELGATSLDTVEEPRVVEIQESVYAPSEHISDDSHDAQSNDESVESLVTVRGSSPLRTLSPADVDPSMSMEPPFLLAVDSGRSIYDEATLGTEPSTEDDQLAFAQSPSSNPESLRDDVSSYIMHSALLVPAARVVGEGEGDSSPDTVAGLEAEDDWTAVDPDESSTPRPSSPADPHSGMAEFTGATRTGGSDLAVSAVLLTQSQYASTILPPITANDSGLSSPNSSTSSGSTRPRVHTSDRPDWAVASQEEQEDDARLERAQRRHSVDSPDWAVAPEVTSNDASSAKKKGRKSDPGSGARKKSRRAWTSR